MKHRKRVSQSGAGGSRFAFREHWHPRPRTIGHTQVGTQDSEHLGIAPDWRRYEAAKRTREHPLTRFLMSERAEREALQVIAVHEATLRARCTPTTGSS